MNTKINFIVVSIFIALLFNSCGSSDDVTRHIARNQTDTTIRIALSVADIDNETHFLCCGVVELGVNEAFLVFDDDGNVTPPFADADSIVFVYRGRLFVERSRTGNSYLNLDAYTQVHEAVQEFHFSITEEYILSLPEIQRPE